MNEFTFTDTKFVTAQGKHRVVKAWARFLKSECRREDFTHALYEHLINHCSFIAHFNRDGFYGYYFTSPERKLRFFARFGESEGCYSGWRDGEYADINQAMVKVATGYIPRVTIGCENEARRRDLAQAKALLLKYGLVEVAQQIPSPGSRTPTTGTQPNLI